MCSVCVCTNVHPASPENLLRRHNHFSPIVMNPSTTSDCRTRTLASTNQELQMCRVVWGWVYGGRMGLSIPTPNHHQTDWPTSSGSYNSIGCQLFWLPIGSREVAEAATTSAHVFFFLIHCCGEMPSPWQHTTTNRQCAHATRGNVMSLPVRKVVSRKQKVRRALLLAPLPERWRNHPP